MYPRAKNTRGSPGVVFGGPATSGFDKDSRQLAMLVDVQNNNTNWLMDSVVMTSYTPLVYTYIIYIYTHNIIYIYISILSFQAGSVKKES